MSFRFSQTLSLLLASLLWLSGTARADMYTDGVNAYKSKNYARAAQLMQTALRMNSHNPDAVFYLGMAQVHLNQLDAARQAFELVIQMAPDSENADKARNNITWITKQQITLASNSTKAAQIMNYSLSRDSKQNYLTHVIPDGKVVHFAANRMPLKVYISDGIGVPGWSMSMKQAILFAMQNWSSATSGRIRFSQTYDESSADIVVHWQKNFPDNILGVSPFQAYGDKIVRSDITMAVCYPDTNKPIPAGELATIATHEMGHAIGLKGHSPYPQDIMFYSTDHNNFQKPSVRDMNTIAMLYKLDADVQNDSGMSTAMTRKYYDLYQKGYEAQTSNRAAEAIAYYRAAMAINAGLPEAKFNLGALLINEGNKMVRQNNLSGAKKNFEEATRLYSELLQLSQPPGSARENLEIAKTNLSIINGALQK